METKRVKKRSSNSIADVQPALKKREEQALPRAAGLNGEQLQLFSHNLFLSLREKKAYFILERPPPTPPPPPFCH